MGELSPARRDNAREILSEVGVRPSKGLGQNFVVDPSLVRRIAAVANVGPDDEVLEIGPGLGALTRALHSTGAAVSAVEIDPRLAAHLRETLPASVRIIDGDALEVDFEELYSDRQHANRGVVLVANLPYNVATPVVMRILERVPAVERMLIMVQREVADRFVATPGGKIYGAVSARIAYFAAASIESLIPPEVFFPQPKVTSALVEMRRLAEVAVDPEAATYDEIAMLIRHGFATRRKMLRRALAGLVSEDGFAFAGVAPTKRAEELSIQEWGKLAQWRRSNTNSRPRS